MKSKQSPNQPLLINRYEDEAIQSVIDGVLATTALYEDKWGVGRLELLVDDELRTKFRKQLDRFNNAVSIHDVVKVRLAGSGMCRAWVALDKAAEEAGATALDPEVWEIDLPDGRVIAFCRHRHDAYAAASGRLIDVWTPEEIGRLIISFPEIALAKTTFPGAQIISAKPKPLSDMPVDQNDDMVYDTEMVEEEV